MAALKIIPDLWLLTITIGKVLFLFASLACFFSQRSIIPTMTKVCDAKQAIRGSGLYRIKLPRVQAFTAYCDMVTDGGGWLVFQRREDGKENFSRTYTEYEKGFGDANEEHWLGLEILHRLTNAYNVKLRIDVEDWEGATAFAIYSAFSIGHPANGYPLRVSGYTGTVGDSFGYSNGERFTTHDKDQDSYSGGNCAAHYKGGWWYKNCHKSNLNGLYKFARTTSYADSIVMAGWKGHYYSLKSTEMKIKVIST